jgi:hypothetical protein
VSDKLSLANAVRKIEFKLLLTAIAASLSPPLASGKNECVG